MANEEIITISDGEGTLASPVLVDNGPSNVTIGSLDVVTIGDGQDTITAKNNDTIKVGNGNDTITIGSNDSLTDGDGSHTIAAGSNDTIKVGNGNGAITAGGNSTITAGNGNDQITAGPHSTIVAGNGPDTVHVGHDSSITLGAGPDNVHAGTTDTITYNKGGPDVTDYDGLTPAFTVPGSQINVSEEQSVSIPITLLPPSLGNEVINGFKPQNGVIGFDTNDFANSNAVLAAAAQVGSNVVITGPGASGTVTLTNTSLSRLSAANFAFFTGTDVINITGVPTDATLSAGTNNGGGSWTLTPAQLSGLTLNAGEPTPVDTITVTMTNPAGQGATSSQSFPLQVHAIPPTVGVSVIPYESGDPITETRLQVSSAVDAGDGGNDYINNIQFSNVPTGTTLSSSSGTMTNDGGGMWTLSTTGNPASFNPEVDVFAPPAQTTNFNLGITANSSEPNGLPADETASTSQNIDVQYEPTTASPTFTASNDSIWQSGPNFSRSFNTFLGVDFPNGFPTSPAAHASTTVLGYNVGGSFGIKAGFQSDLTLNSGSFNGSLPFTINLANTFNKTNDTLEVDPSDSQGTASFDTKSPQGSYSLDFVFDAFLRAFAGSLSINTGGNNNIPLLSLNSSTLSHTFSLPDGIGSVKVAWPTVNTTGSGSGSTISSSNTSNPIFAVNIDPIAVIADILIGSDPFKGSGGLNLGLASISFKYTLAAGTVEPTINLAQAFSLNDAGLTPTLTDNGNPVSFGFGTPTIIQNAPSSNAFDLGLTPDTTLSNTTSLAGQLVLGLTLLKASATATALFGLGSTSASVGPLFHPTTTLHLGSVPIYKNTFPVTFGSQAVNFTVS